jgi:hypothetical protein
MVRLLDIAMRAEGWNRDERERVPVRVQVRVRARVRVRVGAGRVPEQVRG